MGQRLAWCPEEQALRFIIFVEPACGSLGWVCRAAVGPGSAGLHSKAGSTRDHLGPPSVLRAPVVPGVAHRMRESTRTRTH